MIAGNLPNSIGVIDGETWIQTPQGARPATQADVDAYQQSQNQGQSDLAKKYQQFGFQQFTPEQAQAYQATGAKPNADSVNPALGGVLGLYNDSQYGGNNLWYGPQGAPQHTDTRGIGSLEDAIVPGSWLNGEQGQTAWNDLRSGLAVMAMPFVGGGITAGLAAAGAGAGGAAAGAGAAEGGAAAGAGATGVDASTGLFAGESATSGAAGAGAAVDGGAISGGAGSASVVGGAGSDTAASMPAAVSQDPMGGYNIDPETGDVFHGTGDNPFGSNFSGGTGNEGFSGYQPGFLEQAQTQAMSLAKQLGITPATALQQILKAAGRAAPGALGAVAASKQQDAFQRLADQYSAYGAPYRQRLSDLYADPSSFLKSPEVTVPIQQATNMTARSLSRGGNPVDSGNALQQLESFSSDQLFGRLGQEKDRLAGFGGLTSYNAAAPGAATNAVNASSNVFNALGAGAANVFNPPQTLAQQMADFQRLSSGAVH